MVSQISYLLDTNIISELAKSQPDSAVLQQFYHAQHEIAISSIVWHELRFGWLKMPDGQRKQLITKFLHDVEGMHCDTKDKDTNDHHDW